MKSKHTIEIEVEWDVDTSQLCNRAGTSTGSVLWFSHSDLAAMGITKPEPPYVPLVGDIAEEVPTGYVGRVTEIYGSNVVGLNPTDVRVLFRSLRLIHRPEVTS